MTTQLRTLTAGLQLACGTGRSRWESVVRHDHGDPAGCARSDRDHSDVRDVRCTGATVAHLTRSPVILQSDSRDCGTHMSLAPSPSGERAAAQSRVMRTSLWTLRRTPQ
ncbi:hypothetical protein ACGFZQ_44135 [Streptomyces sp. NPDC048254]|uniref:hypothetical protein n=1 Tax=Streptomyces sp. NPDC048254 TaxID=3365525 RepID=UPI00371B17FF